MESDFAYSVPAGMHKIPDHLLDLRPDAEIDIDLLNPRPVDGVKNVWFFWHSGFRHMHPYAQRNIRAWHRRFSKHGWTIRVLDRQADSPLNIDKFLDVHDPELFPRAFVDGTIGGDYAPQHTSDLVRWPLLLKHGGVYADVGLMQIGDLDRLWSETLGNPASPFEVLSYNAGEGDKYSLMNYFLCSLPDNPLFQRCHRLLMKLWNANGGQTSTEGMHASPLLKGLRMMMEDSPTLVIKDGGKTLGPKEVSKLLTDYIIQGQVLTMVMSLVDEQDGWNGPQYVANHVYAPEYMIGSQLVNQLAGWNGTVAFQLLSLPLPKKGEAETTDQARAREIVEECLQKSFGFKLAHGIILRVYGETLGSLWRKHDGSDNVPGTYAHWLRQGMIYLNQDGVPATVNFQAVPPVKKGRLLESD